MGKIHEALQRAEEERARSGGPPSPVAVPGGPLQRPITEPELVRRRKRAKVLRETRRHRLVLSSATATGVTEEYRALRARVQSIRRTREVRSLVVTSTHPGEGKTTTAVNLAVCFGLDRESGTCLVDGDLRTPSVHFALPEPPTAGLAEVLELDVKLEDALVPVPDTRLWVLPVKALPTYPSELLASRRMRDLIDELHSRFETVIVDSPPVLGLPDATTLVDLCDAAIHVVGAGQSARENIDEALKRIDASKVLGTVLNRSPHKLKPYGYTNGR